VHYPTIYKPYFEKVTLLNTSTQALVAGTIGLVASAYDKTIETIHYSIAEEPFYALQKLLVVSQIAKPIEAVHRDILNAVYRFLRCKGRFVHKVAMAFAPDDITLKTAT